MKKIFWYRVAVIVLATVLLSDLATFCLTTKKTKNLYAMTTVVYAVSDANDTVTVKDFNGNLWQFKGAEDWEINDICSCVMDNKGTTYIKDDEIIKVKYSGYLEGWK